jgi:hypothetical protein
MPYKPIWSQYVKSHTGVFIHVLCYGNTVKYTAILRDENIASWYIFFSCHYWNVPMRIYLPREVILLIAESLNPLDQLSLVRAFPDLIHLLTFRHLAIQDEQGNTIIQLLAEQGDDGLLQLLLVRKGTKADSENKKGQTPLSCAAWYGHEKVVKLLLDRDDVNADSRDHYGRTPLSCASWRGHDTVVKLLLERDDVNADSRDHYGRTPLSCAAWRGHETVVKLLLGRDDVNADSRDHYGRTPLSCATSRGHNGVFELLLGPNHLEVSLRGEDSLQEFF